MNSLQTLFFYASHLTPNAGIAKEWITSAAVRINLVCVISGRITRLGSLFPNPRRGYVGEYI